MKFRSARARSNFQGAHAIYIHSGILQILHFAQGRGDFHCRIFDAPDSLRRGGKVALWFVVEGECLILVWLNWTELFFMVGLQSELIIFLCFYERVEEKSISYNNLELVKIDWIALCIQSKRSITCRTIELIGRLNIGLLARSLLEGL